MTMKAERIVAEALTLSPQARAFMIEQLIESLDTIPGDKLTSIWINEVQKRCQEIDDDAIELHDAASVFTKAYATFR